MKEKEEEPVWQAVLVEGFRSGHPAIASHICVRGLHHAKCFQLLTVENCIGRLRLIL